MRLPYALLLTLLATPALAQPADLVLRGGTVITVDKDWRIAQAVAIKDGRFVAVGSNEEIAGRIGPSTQVIELSGKTAVPGLIDSHLHLLFATLNGPAVQLLGANSIADVQRAIGERVARTEPGKWVTLYTINNARIQGVERDRGSIEPGKLADLAVLSQDVTSAPLDAIRDTRAHLTLLGGKVVYRNGM
jgi:predicted amidohydrolase YtcJ